MTAGWLCALALAACDDPDAPLTEDVAAAQDADVDADAPDERVISDLELRDLCELALDESEAAPSPGLDDRTAETRPAEGVCSSGYWHFDTVQESCGSCWHDAIKKSGAKIVTSKRWCYSAPSPPSCGCEAPSVMSWYCKNAC